MPKGPRHFYEFGSFRFDADKHRLLRNGERVHLSPKSAEALVVLVKNAGKLLEREELISMVWPDSFVEDANLNVAISHLRKALGQNGETCEYIETIPRVGYRFVAEVRERFEQPAPLIIEKHTQSRTVIEEEILADEAPVCSDALAVTQPSGMVARVLPKMQPRPMLVATGFALAVTVASLLYLKHERGLAATNRGVQIHSLAVLPPRVLIDESDRAQVSLGVADALITRLARIRSITVRPTSAVAPYADVNQDALKVGRALNVDAVLDGTMQRDHGRTRITLRLIDVNDGSQVWARNFDESDDNLFKLQDSMSQQVADVFVLNLTQRERDLVAQRPTINQEAYLQYVKGNYFWNKRGSATAKSIDYLRRAISLDPNFAKAYATLAAVEATTTATPSPEAEALLDKALQLDDTLAEAHATKAFIKMFHYWDWNAAELELDRALELDPNSAVAHHWKGVYLSIRGRLDEAKAEMHRALDLDPLSLIIMSDIGQLHYFAREYDQAMQYCNRVLGFDPDFWVAHEYLADIYLAKGMDREALNEMLALDYQNHEQRQKAAEAFAHGEAKALLNQKLESWLTRNDSERPTMAIAKVYCHLGDQAQALYWLEQSVSGHRTFYTVYINVDPLYDPLRNDERFKKIVTRLGLAT